jgi:hypothetical protein
MLKNKIKDDIDCYMCLEEITKYLENQKKELENMDIETACLSGVTIMNIYTKVLKTLKFNNEQIDEIFTNYYASFSENMIGFNIGEVLNKMLFLKENYKLNDLSIDLIKNELNITNKKAKELLTKWRTET